MSFTHLDRGDTSESCDVCNAPPGVSCSAPSTPTPKPRRTRRQWARMEAELTVAHENLDAVRANRDRLALRVDKLVEQISAADARIADLVVESAKWRGRAWVALLAFGMFSVLMAVLR